jgi:L,D-transpeptidase ErfK/SrfK
MWKSGYGFAVAFILLYAISSAYPSDPAPQTDALLPDSNWQGEIIGTHHFHILDGKETLMELARDRGLGFTNLKNANPGLDPWLPPSGQVVLLPYATILPVDARPGITINLAEMRLYYIWENEGNCRVRTYPLGIGSEGTETPTGQFAILSKVENPTWTVPLSIRRARPDLPDSIPPGPANPLGKFWMGFSPWGHGLHGTNIPMGVGRRVSHGCLRLYSQDIHDLFNRVTIGTAVQIINTPVKVGKRNSVLFLEVHRNFQEDERILKKEIVRQARALNWSGTLNWSGIDRALQENRGIPFPISRAEQ